MGLTPETANLLFMDGEDLFSKVAKEANVAEYCQALIDAGADVKGTWWAPRRSGPPRTPPSRAC